jgi:5-methylcytosine-specific restriction endonuclease McrA
MNYSDKLNDVRWAKLTERIKNRDLSCVQCGNITNLHVHHSHYRKGREPWEYRESDMYLLCNTCHRKIHSITIKEDHKNKFKRRLKYYDDIIDNAVKRENELRKKGLSY